MEIFPGTVGYTRWTEILLLEFTITGEETSRKSVHAVQRLAMTLAQKRLIAASGSKGNVNNAALNTVESESDLKKT